jgi:hypothetical protein
MESTTEITEGTEKNWFVNNGTADGGGDDGYWVRWVVEIVGFRFAQPQSTVHGW